LLTAPASQAGKLYNYTVTTSQAGCTKIVSRPNFNVFQTEGF
jgi:hypothetical protein